MSLMTDTVWSKAVAGVATACVVGGGTVVLNNAMLDREQSIKIEALEQEQRAIRQEIRDLTETARSLDRNLAILNERLRHDDARNR